MLTCYSISAIFTFEERECDVMLPDYSVIGKRIKTARTNSNMTQEQLANKIDVSITFLSRVERGSSNINLKRLTQIAEILNVSPGYLLTGSNTKSKDYLREDFSEILSKCTPMQQKLIFQISELVYKNGIEANKERIVIPSNLIKKQ